MELASLDREHDQEWLLQQAEKRLAAANEAIRTTRTFFFALLSIAAYIGVVVAGTTDEQLLRIAPVKLPIVNVEVPLTGFYIFVPWLFVLLHFNLLIHLGLTSRKLKVFLGRLEPLDQKVAYDLRNDVANFPLAQWMIAHNDAVLRVVLTVLVWIMLVLVPPFLLLWMQLRFLAYQDETFTWLQAAAVAVDVLLIIGFRAWFVRQIQPETRWVEGIKELWKRRGLSFGLWLRLLLTQPMSRYLIPMIPLGLAGVLAVALSDLLATKRVESCGKKPDTEEGIVRRIERWHCGQNRLDLSEKLLTEGHPSPEHVNALRGELVAVHDRASTDKTIDSCNPQQSELAKWRNSALDALLGLDLRGRHLRGADLQRSVLPRSDLRRAQLEGANLIFAQLEGADLNLAQLERANLGGAYLEGAKLSNAQLNGASLFFAQAEGADFSNAQMKGADLVGVKLKRANFLTAQLEGADLWDAQLMGANLMAVHLERARLWRARLQDANLAGAWLTGADLREAQLAGADLIDAQLEGADLRRANLGWVNLTGADLSYANLTDTENLESTELAGADYVFADGLEGTFLDINQPPPDVLPAP